MGLDNNNNNSSLNTSSQNNRLENKNFYQKIATNSKNDGSGHHQSSYFETLQHKAGIQANRKNGYYVIPDENEKKEIHISENISRETTEIDAIFSFDEDSASNENSEELTDNEFYNDYFVGDEEIDNQHDNEYRQNIQNYYNTNQNQPTYVVQNQVNDYVNSINETIREKKKNIERSDRLVDEAKNKKNIVIISCSLILCLLIFFLILVLVAKGNKIPISDSKEKSTEKMSSSSIKQMPNTIEQTLDDNNEKINCFSTKQAIIYEDENLTKPLNSVERYTLITINNSDISSNYVKYGGGYIGINNLYIYDSDEDSFNNESINFFDTYSLNHKTLYEIKNGKEYNYSISTTITTSLSKYEDVAIEDKDYKISQENIEVNNIGVLSETTETPTQGEPKYTNVSLYRGKQYGVISVDSVGLVANLHYGASQENIDEYDACSHSQCFSIPGSGRPILIGGHNTKAFGKLTQLKVNDIITITTDYGEFKYQVYFTGIGKVLTNSENITDKDYLKDIETGEEMFNYDRDEELLYLYTCSNYDNDTTQPTLYRYAIKAKKIYAKFN